MVDSAWIKNFKLPIAIIGLGKSGASAVNLLKKLGFSDSDLIVYDEKDALAQVNQYEKLLLLKPKTLIVSPGVPLNTFWIQTLINKGAFLTSEISLAASLLTSEKVIGVTGSVGKSTVVSLLGTAIRIDDPNCFVGGNLGIPFCEYALHIINGGPRATWVILELSSYQLENCRGLSLEFSAITFLSANHLERYKNLEHYYLTKMSITSLTKNLCVFNEISKDGVVFSESSKCSYYLTSANKDLYILQKNKINLIGLHNYDNFAVALKLAQLACWSLAAIENMYTFKGLSHRLENLGHFQGVWFVNDSKATAMDSVLVAVASCLGKINSTSTLYLLLGGKDKDLPWHHLAELKNNLRLQFVFFGACGTKAQKVSTLHGPTFSTLREALGYILKKAQVGDTVLLSPGGTSLDEFKNYEERGKFFKEMIRQHYG